MGFLDILGDTPAKRAGFKQGFSKGGIVSLVE